MNRWVLLRGLARDARHWGDFPARLEAAMPAAETLALDLAGNGTRCREPSPADVPAMVEDYRAALARHGAAGPGSLLALSLGGMVAVEWARRYPGEVDRVVLINTSFADCAGVFERLRPGCYPDLFRLLLPTSDRAAEARILAMTSGRSSELQVEQWTAFRRAHRTSAANALRQVVAAARFRLGATLPAAPVLLLASRRDRLVSARCSRAIAGRTGWPLVEHPDAGHDLPLDDPAWVVRQVAGWSATINRDAAAQTSSVG